MKAAVPLLALLLVSCDTAPVVGSLGNWSVAFSGQHVSFGSASPQAVPAGGRLSLQVKPDLIHTLSPTVGGTCAAGDWAGDIYTTGPIRSSCTLTFSALRNDVPEPPVPPIPFTASVQAGLHGTVAPAGAVTIDPGDSQLFTAGADSHYHVQQWLLDGVVAQTGGGTYTLSNVAANHTVEVSFVIDRFAVTPGAGVNGAISPSAPQTIDYGSTVVLTATPDVGFGVLSWSVDGSTVQTGGTSYSLTNITANHSVSVSFASTTLSTSVSSLALSVDDTGLNAALTGNPRVIAVTNTGSIAATNLTVNSSGLPAGTSIGVNTCSSVLAAGASCSVALIPGSVASADGSSLPCTAGTAPVGGAVTVSANNGNSVQVDIYVLSYGCQYQGGFLFSIDDSTPNTASIGGKVMSLVDQAGPFLGGGPQSSSVIWASNGTGSTGTEASFDTIPFIDETSTTATPSPIYASARTTFNTTYSNESTFPFPSAGSFSSCNGAVDGSCNSSNILALYEIYATNYDLFGSSPYALAPGPTNGSYYAAGLCHGTIAARTDWFLPAICELDGVDLTASCPAGAQSIVGGLSFLMGDSNAGTPSTSCSPPVGTDCLAGIYWSSSQTSFSPTNQAWIEQFDALGSGQNGLTKNEQAGVRCIRSLTP